jgi:hypothetical protein
VCVSNVAEVVHGCVCVCVCVRVCYGCRGGSSCMCVCVCMYDMIVTEVIHEHAVIHKYVCVCVYACIYDMNVTACSNT